MFEYVICYSHKAGATLTKHPKKTVIKERTEHRYYLNTTGKLNELIYLISSRNSIAILCLNKKYMDTVARNTGKWKITLDIRVTF
jgi:hypothetical protein